MMTVVHASLPTLTTMCSLRASARGWLPPTTIRRLQTRAMMAQACSGLILAGAPERGASLKRSRTSAEVSAPERQRARHWLTVLRQTSRRAAISPTFRPSAERRIMRARGAICCAVPCVRIRRSSSPRSSALTSRAGAE